MICEVLIPLCLLILFFALIFILPKYRVKLDLMYQQIGNFFKILQKDYLPMLLVMISILILLLILIISENYNFDISK